MSDFITPDRLFFALLDEWNESHPGGEALDPQLQEMILRYMTWARTISAECVINRLSRTIELTPCPGGLIQRQGILEMIRKIDPSDTNQLVKPEKRDFRINEPPWEKKYGRFIRRTSRSSTSIRAVRNDGEKR